MKYIATFHNSYKEDPNFWDEEIEADDNLSARAQAEQKVKALQEGARRAAERDRERLRDFYSLTSIRRITGYSISMTPVTVPID